MLGTTILLYRINESEYNVHVEYSNGRVRSQPIRFVARATFEEGVWVVKHPDYPEMCSGQYLNETVEAFVYTYIVA